MGEEDRLEGACARAPRHHLEGLVDEVGIARVAGVDEGHAAPLGEHDPVDARASGEEDARGDLGEGEGASG
jgi:hypothetical protein